MNKLIPLEFENQRIMTTKVLAEQYGTEEKNIQMNFSNNEKRFVEGKHFYKLEGQTLKDFKNSLPNEIREPIKFAPVLYLWTDRGAARHAKILDTDQAWNVYEQLEDNYFNPTSLRIPTGMSKELQAIFMLDNKQQQLENQINNVKVDVTALKDSMPLFSVECKVLQALVKKAAIQALGGDKSKPAYKNKSVRSKVFSDIQCQLRRQFGVKRYEGIKRKDLETAKNIVEQYQLPYCLQQEIDLVNNQISVPTGGMQYGA